MTIFVVAVLFVLAFNVVVVLALVAHYVHEQSAKRPGDDDLGDDDIDSLRETDTFVWPPARAIRQAPVLRPVDIDPWSAHDAG